MLEIANVEKYVGTQLVLGNADIPSDLSVWECERVRALPVDDSVIGIDPSYRFEYKACSDYSVPLCIYLYRNAEENGSHKFQNNLMEVEDDITAADVGNSNLFTKRLSAYATEVILSWAKDQKMI